MTHRIAFISPFSPDENLVPPLGLLIMASLLEEKGWDVMLFEQNGANQIEPDIMDFKPHIAGISCVTANILKGKAIAAHLKENLPMAKIILGGPHPSALPMEVMNWPEVDAVVIGEGETSMMMLADWLKSRGDQQELKQIPNLYYRSEGRIMSTDRAGYLTSDQLNRLPIPAYHLLSLEETFTRLRHGLFRKGRRVLPYMATRGCPQTCTFCCRMMGQHVRSKSPERVVDEITHLVERYQLDEIYFEDDNFTASKSYAHKVLDGIIQKRLNIHLKFANGLRIDGINESLLTKMRLAGCYALSFGLESGSLRVLKMMQKKYNLTKVTQKIELAKRLGFLVGANMIIGYPGETETDIWQSYRFFESLKLDSVALVNLIPFPGTKVRELCEQNGYLTPDAACWDNYYFDLNDPKIFIETEFLQREDLKRIMQKMFFKLYMNPRRTMTLLKNMRPSDVWAGAKVAARKYFNRSGENGKNGVCT